MDKGNTWGVLNTEGQLKPSSPLTDQNKNETPEVSDPFSPVNTGLPVVVYDKDGNRIGNVWSPSQNGLKEAIANRESGNATAIYFDFKTGKFTNYPSSTMSYKDGKINLNVSNDVANTDWYKEAFNGQLFKDLAKAYAADPTGKSEIEISNSDGTKEKKTINDLLKEFAEDLEESSKKYQGNIDTRNNVKRITGGALDLTDEDIAVMGTFKNFKKESFSDTDAIFLPDVVKEYFKDYSSYDDETGTISAKDFYDSFYHLNTDVVESIQRAIDDLGGGALGDSKEALKQISESDKDYAIDLIRLKTSEAMVDLVTQTTFNKDDMTEEDKAYASSQYAKCFALYQLMTQDTPNTDSWTGFNLAVQNFAVGFDDGIITAGEGIAHFYSQLASCVVDGGVRTAAAINAPFSWFGELLGNLFSGGWDKMTQETRNMYEHFDEWYSENTNESSVLGEMRESINELGKAIENREDIAGKLFESAEQDMARSYANAAAMQHIGRIGGLILTQIVATNPIGQAVGGAFEVGLLNAGSVALTGYKFNALVNMAKTFSMMATTANNATSALKYMKILASLRVSSTVAGFMVNMYMQGVVDTFVENPALTDAMLYGESNDKIADFQNALRWNILWNTVGEAAPFAGKKGIKWVKNTSFGAVAQASLRKATNFFTLPGRKVYEGIAEFVTRRSNEFIVEEGAEVPFSGKLNPEKRWQAIRQEIIKIQKEIRDTSIFRGEGSWTENAKKIDDLVQTRIDLEEVLGTSKKLFVAQARQRIIQNAGLDIESAEISQYTAELSNLAKKMKQTNMPGSFSKETGDYINDLFNRQLLLNKQAFLETSGKVAKNLSKKELEGLSILNKRIADYEASLPANFADSYKAAVNNFMDSNYRYYKKLKDFLASDAGGNIVLKEDLDFIRSNSQYGANGEMWMPLYAVGGFKSAEDLEALLRDPSRIVREGKTTSQVENYSRKTFSPDVTYLDPNYTRDIVTNSYAKVMNAADMSDAVVRAGRATSIPTDSQGNILKTPKDVATAKKNLYNDLQNKFESSFRENLQFLGPETIKSTKVKAKDYYNQVKRGAQRTVNDILGLDSKGLRTYASTLNSSEIEQINKVYSLPEYSRKIKTIEDLKAMYDSLSSAQKKIVKKNVPGFEAPGPRAINANDIKNGSIDFDTRSELAKRVVENSDGEKTIAWRTQGNGVDDFYGSSGGSQTFLSETEREHWKNGRWVFVNNEDPNVWGYGTNSLVFPIKKSDILDKFTADSYIDSAEDILAIKTKNPTLEQKISVDSIKNVYGDVKNIPHYDELIKLDEKTLKKIAEGDPRVLLDVTDTKIIKYLRSGSTFGGDREFVLFPDRNPELLQEGIDDMVKEASDIELEGATKNSVKSWNNAVTNNDLDVLLSRQYIKDNKGILKSGFYKDLVGNARAAEIEADEALALREAKATIEQAEKGLKAGDLKGTDAAKLNAKKTRDFNKVVKGTITEAVDGTVDALMENPYLEQLIKEYEKKGISSDVSKQYIIYQWLYDNSGKSGVLQDIAFRYYNAPSKISQVKITSDAARAYSKKFQKAAESIIESKLNKLVAKIQEEGTDGLVDMESTAKRVEEYFKDITDLWGSKRVIEAWDREAGKFKYYQVDHSTYNLVTNYPTFKRNNLFARTMARINSIARFGQITIRAASLVTQGFKDTFNAVILGGWDQLLFDNPNTYKKIAEYIGPDVVDAFRKSMTPDAWKDFLAAAEWSGLSVEEAIAKAEVNNELLQMKIEGGPGTSTSYFSYRNLYEPTDEVVESINKQLEAANDTWTADTKAKWKEAYEKARVAWYNASQKGQGAINRVEDYANFLHNARETFLRKQVYRQNFMEALESGKSLAQARNYASYFMRNATTNFTRGFAWGDNIIRSIPYFGAMMNGASSMVRLLEVDPLGIMMRFTTDLVIPTVGLVAMSLEDPRDAELYMNIPEWEKEGNLHWVVNGEVITIPLPEELAKFILPIRHAVESMYGANKHAFGELLLNDILNLPTIPLNSVMLLDWNKANGDPTVWDRVSALGMDLFNTLAPNAGRTAYIATTGKDPYTGEDYGRKKLYVDENGEYQYMTVSEYGFANDMAELFKGFGWDVSAIMAEAMFSSIFGTGSLDVAEGIRDFVVTAQEGNPDITALISPSLERAGNVMTGVSRTDADQARISWYGVLNELRAKKNEMLAPDGKLAKYSQDIDMAKDIDTLNKKTELYDSEVRNWQNMVIDRIKQYNSAYGDYYDRSKLASTISLLTTNLSIDRVRNSDNYYNARALAIETMMDAGFDSPSDNSIFGYVYRDPYSGEVNIRYTDPLIISLSQNLLWYQADEAVQMMKDQIELSGLKDKYNKEIYPKYSNAMNAKNYTEANKIAADWDVELIKAIKPIIDEYTVDELLNKSTVIDLLDNYVLVPSTTDAMGKGKYYSSKTGLNKRRGFAQSYIKKIYSRLKEKK